MIYDFKSLSSYDFELLIRDLLQKELHQNLEAFKPGRDSGIDIRLSINKRNNVIIQCKHYANSKYSDLILALKNEKEKIEKLKPERYIIATSQGLTPLNKEEISKLFDPYLHDYSDIIDNDRINNLLKRFPDIEKDHYKLWMTSTEIMRLILHTSAFNRIKIDRTAIQKKAKVYVQNPSYRKALRILGKNHYCIISGLPGIGKTTLAEILCLKYLSREYSLVSISTSINDAYSLLDEESKQVFLFDDFLGSIFYEDQLKDNTLLKFIEHIETSKNKRFILTTREYILQQAINSSEGYARAKLKKCVIQQNEYTKKIKAQILYNHLYFSGLTSDYFISLVNEKKYYNVINHKNYTPRIIEWMTNVLNVKNIKPKDYADEFINALDNPKLIWRVAFEKHISAYSRTILILLGLVYDTIALDDFTILVKEFDKKNIGVVEWNILYKSSLKELENTFIILENHSDNLLKFHNPSIKDFIVEYIVTNTDIIDCFLKMRLLFWDQYCPLISLLINIDKVKFQSLVIDILCTMVNNIDLSALEIDNILSNSIRKKKKNLFSRVRFIFDTFKSLDKDIPTEVSGKMRDLVMYETKNNFTANYDSWCVYKYLLEINDNNIFLHEKSIIFENMISSKTHEELNEYYDIYYLFNDDTDEYDEAVKERFNEILDDYYLDDDLYSLKETEEKISDIADKLHIRSLSKLDNIRERIDALEREEQDSGDEYDDESRNSFLEKQRSEKRELEQIDDMFESL